MKDKKKVKKTVDKKKENKSSSSKKVINKKKETKSSLSEKTTDKKIKTISPSEKQKKIIRVSTGIRNF
ncbi:hypothetical protein GF386_00320, partial [Candidatus Pacearchaeota archaeon]|nr:hypothetical protein [Candidatus Pacearchaeota archaeon]MBD3282727.1 hypothetical protein [Candidatus Pacearchaeota archaeon]